MFPLHFPYRASPCAIRFQLTSKGKAVPLQAWTGTQGSRKLRFPDFVTTAQDGGKIVSLKHRPPLPPGNAPSTHFCKRLIRPQGHCAIGRILCQWKIPLTSAGIEPATFRFVAQHLNHRVWVRVVMISTWNVAERSAQCSVHSEIGRAPLYRSV